MRILAALCAWFLLTTFVPPVAPLAPPPPTVARLSFVPVPLDRRDPGRNRIGALRWLGGWRLTSDDPRFGGLSAMHVADGAVTAVGDTGILFRFAVPATPRGEGRVAIATLPAGPGSPIRKGDRDAEAMAVHGDQAWLGFEGSNAVWRYRLPGWRAEAGYAPAAMAGWPANRGSEAMLRLDDGRFLVLAEGATFADGASALLLFDRDPADPSARALTLGFHPPRGYQVTDAAWLPDGRMLVLTRRCRWFEGVSARLVVADPPPARAGARVRGRELARLRRPLTVDNMEALAVTEEDGRTIVWIASDDNYNPFQRTLLMKFALEE